MTDITLVFNERKQEASVIGETDAGKNWIEDNLDLKDDKFHVKGDMSDMKDLKTLMEAAGLSVMIK